MYVRAAVQKFTFVHLPKGASSLLYIVCERRKVDEVLPKKAVTFGGSPCPAYSPGGIARAVIGFAQA